MKKVLLFFLIFFLISSKAEVAETIIFTINNKPITSIDIQERISYLNILNQTEKLNDPFFYNSIKEDLINLYIYHEYALENKLNIKDKDIELQFVELKNSFSSEITFYDLLNKVKTNEDNIKFYLKLDLQKKLINERLLELKMDDNKNNFNLDDYMNIYNFFINSIYIYDYVNNADLNFLIKEIEINGFQKVINILKKENYHINYNLEKKINLRKLNNEYKNQLLNNQIDITKKNDMIVISQLKKEFKTNINLNYTFIQITSDNKELINKFSKENNNCDFYEKNIENYKNEMSFNKFENMDINKLQFKIFNNLSKKDDSTMISMNNKYHLVIICNIDYNMENLLSNKAEERFTDLVFELEIDFLNAHKNKYNLIIND